jgi:predicted site-specific integrase-resolvase
MVHETVPGLIVALSNMEGGPYYTRGQAANLLGVSYDTIRAWAKKPDSPKPSLKVQHGKLLVNVYTDEDIAALREWQSTIHFGRPVGSKNKPKKSA